MVNGAWSILIAVRGGNDLRNDGEVEVGLYAGADPIELGADRSVLANSTYTATDDPRFRAETHGRVVDGVLTTDPVNARFKFSANGKYYDRPLRGARLRLSIAADGVGQGYLAGYSPIDELYQNQVAFNGDTFVSVSAANAIGYTCNGLYAAMHALADGDRNPTTGICSSLSTQYRITAVPASVATVGRSREQAIIRQMSALPSYSSSHFIHAGGFRRPHGFAALVRALLAAVTRNALAASNVAANLGGHVKGI